jgi:hypothetical protein
MSSSLQRPTASSAAAGGRSRAGAASSGAPPDSVRKKGAATGGQHSSLSELRRSEANAKARVKELTSKLAEVEGKLAAAQGAALEVPALDDEENRALHQGSKAAQIDGTLDELEQACDARMAEAAAQQQAVKDLLANLQSAWQQETAPEVL